MKRLRLAVVVAGADVARVAARFMQYLARKSVYIEGFARENDQYFLKVRTGHTTAELERIATQHHNISTAFAHC